MAEWEKVTDPAELAFAKQQLTKSGGAAEKELTPAFAAKQLYLGANRLDKLGKGPLSRSDPRSALSEYVGSMAGAGKPGRFDSEAISLLPFAKKLARSKGEGSQSDAEGRDYRELLPNMMRTDAVNRDRIANLRRLASEVLTELGEPIPTGAVGDTSVDDLIAEYQRRKGAR